MYKTGFDYWRDTAASYGVEEARGIVSRYLELQKEKCATDLEEAVFCREAYEAMISA